MGYPGSLESVMFISSGTGNTVYPTAHLPSDGMQRPSELIGMTGGKQEEAAPEATELFAFKQDISGGSSEKFPDAYKIAPVVFQFFRSKIEEEDAACTVT